MVDVIFGGSPCQDLSIAGNRKGMKHTDRGDDETTRSGLFMEQIRIVKEMRERDRANGNDGVLTRPRYMVWENVPGAFSSGQPKGSDFAAVIEEIIKVAEPGACVCVCVYRTKDGAKPDATTLTMAPGVLPGVPTTRSISECHNGGEGLVSWPISTDSQHRPFYLTMNIGEKPRVPNHTRLSDILETNPDPKYNLSAKACQGILNQAERRGKPLPTELKAALMEQSASKNEPVNLGGGKGLLIQHDRTGCLSTLNNQSVLGFTNRGYESGEITETLRAEPHSAYPMVSQSEPTVLESNQNHATITNNGVSPTLPASMGMGGGYVPMVSGTINPGAHPGSYNGQDAYNDLLVSPPRITRRDSTEAWEVKPETSDTNRSGQGHSAQGSSLTASYVDCRNGNESPDVNGTLQAKSNGGYSYNCGIVIRTNESSS